MARDARVAGVGAASGAGVARLDATAGATAVQAQAVAVVATLRADAEPILKALGYSQGDTLALKQSRAVVPVNWHQWPEEKNAEPLNLVYSDELSTDGLE